MRSKLASVMLGGAAVLMAAQLSAPAQAATALKPTIGPAPAQTTAVDKVDYRCYWRYGHRSCWWVGSRFYRGWDRDDWRWRTRHEFYGPRTWG